jgi:hypothetical protein
MRSKLLQMMRAENDPWEIAEVYSGRQHFLDDATLDFLLDDLERRLEVLLALPDWDPTFAAAKFPAE